MKCHYHPLSFKNGLFEVFELPTDKFQIFSAIHIPEAVSKWLTYPLLHTSKYFNFKK